MAMRVMHRYVLVLAAAFMLAITPSLVAAEDSIWSVTKSSGEVWISSGDVQQASLKTDDSIKPGDTVRTGRNGRVLLVRGEEHIMIAPNSVVGLPSQPTEGLSTTIVQKAGSILLEVEKRNVKHFEVETPYLAAVVKGTQFRVSVNATSTSVDVIRGQVEVADFKSGQIAQVMPGQKAIAFEHGKPGLSLSGAGTFNPIEQGKPRPPSVNRVPVPKGGLSAPRHAANGQATRTLAAIDRSGGKAAATSPPQRHSASTSHNAPRISSALGEVKLNFHKVTHGLARGTTTVSNGGGRNSSSTIWSSSGSSSMTTSPGANSANTGPANAAADGVAAGGAFSGAAAVAAVNGGNNGNGNGNGASGNGHGNGNANGNGNPKGSGNGNGHANANGHGNGNNGNGNGNGHGNGNGNNGNGNGNGNANGHGKN
jgi:FecR-like protein